LWSLLEALQEVRSEVAPAVGWDVTVDPVYGRSTSTSPSDQMGRGSMTSSGPSVSPNEIEGVLALIRASHCPDSIQSLPDVRVDLRKVVSVLP
jgi:hypothetical protein